MHEYLADNEEHRLDSLDPLGANGYLSVNSASRWPSAQGAPPEAAEDLPGPRGPGPTGAGEGCRHLARMAPLLPRPITCSR